MIQFTNNKRIVFLAYFLVLTVLLAHAISYSNIAVEGQQNQFNVRIHTPPRQQVPIGNSLTIFGTTTYNTTKDYTVYANSNDLKFQKVIAVGSSEIIIIQVGFLRMIRTIIPLQKEQTLQLKYPVKLILPIRLHIISPTLQE